MKDFSVPGKWVLAGEHSVLRGGSAVALPHPHWGMGASWDLHASLDRDLTPLLVELVQELPGAPAAEVLARVRVSSTLPQGGGLGSSAALCVLAARVSGLTDLTQIRTCATELENQFHGKSSGMDVAAVTAGGPIFFTPGQVPRDLRGASGLNAHVSFVDTGHRTSTRQAIAHVRQQGETQVKQGDLLMAQAVDLAQHALELPLSAALPQIAQGMALSMEAYRAWDLLPPGTDDQVSDLMDQGALGVRLTGAGLGGFLVALWPHPR